jgi:hypothetical protein
MSFGSNGVDRVRSLWKIPTQLRLGNLDVNGASDVNPLGFVPDLSMRGVE